MSKALKKLIDINRLREFKNKLVGAGSAYVQTGAVDQTIAGTKTFSKPIVGSVTGNAATATKATQDAAGNTITTTYATKSDLANYLPLSGGKITGRVEAHEVLLTAPNGFMSQYGGYTLVLRNDGRDIYLLISDKDGVPGTWNDARPLVINNSTGVCNINGNASTATKAANADHATKADSATKATSADRASAANCVISNTDIYHEIRLDWNSQVPGCVGLRIDATDIGGIVTTNNIRAQWYAAYPDGPEAHNAMWGGRDITAAFDAGTVSANIANGTFKDIFPGDYITKQVTIPQVLADDGTTVIFAGGTYTVNWVVADCDYWINKGHEAMTNHHVAIVPQAPIFYTRMNPTNTTEGGYAGSEMFQKIIPACATGIVNAFGSSHILTFSDGISNSVDVSHVSSGITQFVGTPGWWGEWVSVQCNLMSEKMVYGAPICSAGAMDNTMALRQMSAFRLSGNLIGYNRSGWWLRDVASSSLFAVVSVIGGSVGSGVYAYANYASLTYGGVRPFALLV